MGEVAARAVEDPKVTGLVELARGGDDSAWAALFGLYRDDIAKMTRGLLHGDNPAAEDLAQRVWSRAQKGVASFRGEVPFVWWLRKICRNLHKDDLRRHGRQARVLSGSLDGAGSDGRDPRLASPGFEDRLALSLDLRRALAELPEEEREAFLLVKAIGYSSLEVAAIVGAPASTVRDRVRRARGKLRAALGVYRWKTS